MTGRSAAVFSLLVFWGVRASAAGEYLLDHWTTETGLPQINVQCFVQTRDGFLWAGTWDGLARFDGLSWKTYRTASYPNLPHNNCIALAEATDGTLWIGTRAGLVGLRAGAWLTCTNAELSNEARVWDLAAAKNGDIWAGTTRGVFRVSSNGQESELKTPIEEVLRRPAIAPLPYHLHLAADGALWLGQWTNVYRFHDEKWETIPIDINPNNHVTGRFFEDVEGGVYITTRSALLRWKGGRLQNLYMPKERPLISAMLQKNGKLWASSDGITIGRLADGHYLPLVEWKHGGHVDAFYEDSQGDLWAGISGRGALRIRMPLFRTLSTNEGLAHPDTVSICQGKTNLWIATRGGVSAYHEGKFMNFPGGQTAIVEDSRGRVWAGGSGVYSLRRDVFELFPGTGGEAPLRVNCVYAEATGDIWIGTDHGLYLIPRGEEEIQRLEPAASVHAILRTRDGALWLGLFGEGLMRIKDESVRRYSDESGISAEIIGPAYEDEHGCIWSASSDGLYRYKNGKIVRLTITNGLSDDIVMNVLPDGMGNFWLNGHRGIQRIRQVEAEQCADGKIQKVSAAIYGVAHGMATIQGNGAALPNSCRAADGRLWFPTALGVVVVDPADVRTEAPRPVIEEVFSDEEKITERLNVRLKAGRGKVMRFTYTAAALRDGANVLFECRLLGHTAGWIDMGRERSVWFTSVAPGDHTFEVRAKTAGGETSSSAAQFAFSIAPHFHETGWFYGVAALIILGAGVAAHSYRARQMRQVFAAQEALAVEQERTRIARDLHDELGSAIGEVSLLARLAERDSATAEKDLHIRRINQSLADASATISELVWALNPRNDSLESLVHYVHRYAGRLLGLAGIELRFRPPEALPEQGLSAEVRHAIVQIAKEAMHNVIQHAEATQVELELRVEEGLLSLSLTDNGRGFARALIASSGNGLDNMVERAKQLRGTLDIDSDPGRGTRIHLRVPLKEQKHA